MHVHWGYPLFLSNGQENNFPTYIGLCTLVFKTSTWNLEFMLYHVVFICGIFEIPPMFLPKLCSGGFTLHINKCFFVLQNSVYFRNHHTVIFFLNFVIAELRSLCSMLYIRTTHAISGRFMWPSMVSSVLISVQSYNAS